MKLPRILSLLLSVLLLAAFGLAQNAATTTQTVLVLPFSNASRTPGLEWISEAFPEVLAQRLTSQSLYLISRDDRLYAFDRLGLPANLHASRATLYRVAEQMDADFVVLGTYGYDGQTFTTRAQVLDMKSLHLSDEQVESGPLPDLISIQNQLAWDVLKLMRPQFNVPRQQFVQAAPSVRLDAFENYIRGVSATTRPEKIRRFREAVRLNPQYRQAILQLGKTYYAGREYDQAANWLSKIPADDPASGESSFLLGLSYYSLGQYERAANAFKTTQKTVPLTEVYNNIGVVESRRGHREALNYFEKAVKADPGDPDYHFNLAVALYRNGESFAAQKQLREVLSRRPNDTEAKQLQDLIASGVPFGGARQPSPVMPGSPAPAPVQQTFTPLTRIKRNYDESSYRQLALEVQNAIEQSLASAAPGTHPELREERGRQLLANGQAAEAEKQFRDAIQHDPTNADAHAGLAQALFARNNFTGARNEANAALRLEPSADAYLVLARINLRDNDVAGAEKNLSQALSLDPTNQEAENVKREVERRKEASAPQPE